MCRANEEIPELRACVLRSHRCCGSALPVGCESWDEAHAVCFDLGGELQKTHSDQRHRKHTPALNISWGSAGLLKHVIMKHLT